MKTINKIFCALFVLATIAACDTEKLTNLQDEIKIYVNPDAVDNKKEISLINASTGAEITDDVEISISGEVASDVYSSDGKAELVIDNGGIVIGLKQSVAPTADNPKSVTAVFESDNYLKKSVKIEFDGTPVEETTIYLIPKNDLPDNVEVNDKSGSQGSEIVVESDVTDVKIEAGTKFTKPDGSDAPAGDVKIEVVTLDATEDSGSDNGFNPLDELPELETESGDGLIVESIVKINPTVGGELVIPDELEIDVPAGKDLYLILPDGTAILIPQLVAKSAKTNNLSVLIAILQILQNLGFSLEDLSQLIFAIVETVTQSDVCPNKNITFVNNGHAASYTFAISEVGKTGSVYSKSFALFNGESVTKGGITLNTTKNYEYTVNVNTVDGSKVLIPSTPITCSDLTSTINLTKESVLPSQNRNINLNIDCPSVSIALDETIIRYKKAGGSFVIFGKTINGSLNGKFPQLEDATDYIFKFFYTKERISSAATGSEIENLINNVDIDEVCVKVEAEL